MSTEIIENIEKQAKSDTEFARELRTKFTAPKTTLKTIAQPKLSTVNPGINELTRSTNKPLIIKVNNPSVTILKGRVIRSTIGFMNVFTTPRPIETTMAVKKLSIFTPGKK